MSLRFSRWLKVLSIGCGVAACGGESTEPPKDALVLQTTPHSLAPGEETYLCQYFPPSGPTHWIDRIDVDEAEGLHHLFVFRAAAADGLSTTLSPCPDDHGAEYKAQLPVVKPGGSFAMPAGVAVSIGADDGLLLQMHMLNTSTDPVDVSITWRAHVVAASEVEKPAGLFLFSITDIDLPPHRLTTVSKTCPAPLDVEMFAANGHFHTHAIGFDATIAGARILDGAGADGGARVLFDPPRAVHAGDPISWSCSDVNAGATDVRYGPSFAKNEMCNFAAYVFPVKDSQTFRCH